MMPVGVVLCAGIGAAVNGWLPDLIPAWRMFLIVAGMVLIALLGTPIVRNRQRRKPR